jgi:hypothetical protein
MFDIVIDYPDSTPALHDLKVGFKLNISTLVASTDMSSGNVGMLTACRSTWPARAIAA